MNDATLWIFREAQGRQICRDLPSTLSRRAERPTTAVSTPLTSLPQTKISHISHLTSTKFSVPKHPTKVNPAVHWSAPR